VGGVQPSRESERPVVPWKPVNAGGGKRPHFWSASDEDEDEEIGVSLEPPEKVRIDYRDGRRSWESSSRA
jgi:hypothetical protein